MECFEKSRRGKPLLPLQSLQNYEILYQGPNPYGRTGAHSSSPIRGPYCKENLSPNRPTGLREITRLWRQKAFESRPLRPRLENTTEASAAVAAEHDTGKESDAANEAATSQEHIDQDTAPEKEPDDNSQVLPTESKTSKPKNEPKSKDTKRGTVPKATNVSFELDPQERAKSSKTSPIKVRSAQMHSALQTRLRSAHATGKERGRPTKVPYPHSATHRRSTFPALVDHTRSPYRVNQALSPDPVKLRMSHGPTSPTVKRGPLSAKEREPGNRGS